MSWWSKLTGREKSAPAPLTPPPPASKPLPPARWVEAADNPFKVRVLESHAGHWWDDLDDQGPGPRFPVGVVG